MPRSRSAAAIAEPDHQNGREGATAPSQQNGRVGATAPTRQKRPPRRTIANLDADMKPGDIAHRLQDLQFFNGKGMLQVDQGVRDYLLRVVRQR
jgi:hypothetical protein